jgi:hypothetical protein
MAPIATLLQPVLLSHAWVWWTSFLLYNPAVKAVARIAPALKPLRPGLRVVWGFWNAGFAVFSLLGALNTYRCVQVPSWPTFTVSCPPLGKA